MQTQQTLFPHWMRGFLLIATAYNAGWGIFIGWFPSTFYSWILETPGLEAPEQIIWLGRGVLVMAALYLATAIHPSKFWYLPFFGAFTKVAGSIWFYFNVLEQAVGDKALFHLLMNDWIWVPFLLWIGVEARRDRLRKLPKKD